MAVTSTPIWNTTKLSCLPVPARITAQIFTVHSQCNLWPNKKPSTYESWQNHYPFTCSYWNFKSLAGSSPYRLDSHVTFLVQRRQTKQSLPLWRAVHLSHWTCLLALSCPVPCSEVFMYRSHARHPKHFYLYLPSSSSSILLLLPHPKAPST